MKTYSRKKGSECSDVIINLNELCRLCLAKEEELVPIFNDEEPVPLPLRIMACVALEVVEDDGLPNMICHPCRYQLDKTYTFRKKCESSDIKLRRHLKLLRKSGKYSDLTEEDDEDMVEEQIEETEDINTQQRNNTGRPQNVKDYLEDLVVEENTDDEGGYMEVLDEHVDERELLGGTITYIQQSEELIEEEEDPENITLSLDTVEYDKEACTLNREMKQELIEPDESIVDESGLFLLSEDNSEMMQENEHDQEQDEDHDNEHDQTNLDSLAEMVKESLAKEHGLKGDLQFRLERGTGPGNVTHVHVTTDDGSVVVMELTTEEPQLMQEDDDGELKVFQCPHCPKAFARRIQLNRHSSVHMEQRGFSCNVCEKWFPTRSALIRHERIHTGEKPFECGVCKRCFAQKEILYRHLMTHTGQKPYPCNQCDKSFTQKEALKTHMRSHSKSNSVDIQLHRCTLCPKVFCHASGLSRHLVTHTGKTFKCRDCDKSFSDKSSLRRHHKMTNHQS